MVPGSAPEEERNAGATATIALARRDKVVVANVGDSRAVLSRRYCAAQEWAFGHVGNIWLVLAHFMMHIPRYAVVHAHQRP